MYFAAGRALASVSKWVIAYGLQEVQPASPIDDVEIIHFHSIAPSTRSGKGSGIVIRLRRAGFS